MVRKKVIFYGWWIVLATSVINLVGAGFFFYSFTAFFNPLVYEFKWSYAATSLASSLRSLESGIAAPLVGFLTDKFGARRLILTGAAWAGIGCLLLSRIDSLWSFYLTFFLTSIGASLMFPLPSWTVVANWFFRKRGTAMGILVAAVGVGGVLIPLVSWLITLYGWRVTFIIAGFSMWAIGIPLSLVVKHHPEQYGSLPDGEQPSVAAKTGEGERQPQPKGETFDFGVRQAIKTRTFWAIALVATVSSAGINAVAVHIMPYLLSIQMSREIASSIAALVVLISVAGRMGFGWLGDRMDKKRLLIAALLLQAFGLVIFAYTRSVVHAVGFLILFGPGFGGVLTLRLTIQGDYFGRKAFGSIQGLMQGIHMIGTMVSPVFAGWVYDVHDSYKLAWLALAALILLSLPLLMMLKPAKAPPSIADTQAGVGAW